MCVLLIHTICYDYTRFHMCYKIFVFAPGAPLLPPAEKELHFCTHTSRLSHPSRLSHCATCHGQVQFRFAPGAIAPGFKVFLVVFDDEDVGPPTVLSRQLLVSDVHSNASLFVELTDHAFVFELVTKPRRSSCRVLYDKTPEGVGQCPKKGRQFSCEQRVSDM